jgi:hypothetical protein
MNNLKLQKTLNQSSIRLASDLVRTPNSYVTSDPLCGHEPGTLIA